MTEIEQFEGFVSEPPPIWTNAPSGIDVRWEIVTPERAAYYLSKNEGNRKLKPMHTARLDADMQADRWLINGDTIRFDRAGRLIDGQNRLTALTTSGTSQILLIVNGLDPAAQGTIDINVQRTVADNLTMHGVNNGPVRQALARYLMAYDAGTQVAIHSYQPTKTEHFQFAFSEPMELGIAVNSLAVKGKIGASGTILGAAAEVAARHSPEMALDFFVNQVIEAVGLNQGSPALALRKRLHSLGRGDQFWFSIKAYMMHVRGEEAHKLYGPNAGWAISNVPRIEALLDPAS